MSYNPTVSVVIPAYNPDGVLQRLLDQLKRQTYPVDLMEIIVVDDCSQTPIEQTISSNQDLPLTILRHSANQGQAAARNTGIQHASHDLLIFLDSDVIPDDNLIQTHAEQFESQSKKLYFGTCRWHPEVKVNHFTRFARWFEFDCVLDKPELDFIDFNGANFSISRSILLESGIMFEEDFTGYGMEDLEFGFMLKKKGFQFDFLPEAVVLHHRTATVEEQIRRAGQSVYSMLYFMNKHPEEKVFRSLHYIPADIFESCAPVLRGAHECAHRLLNDLDKKQQLSLFEQEIIAACSVFLIEYAPWEELYITQSKDVSIHLDSNGYTPQLKNSVVEWAFRVHFLDRIRRGDDSAKKLYNGFIQPLSDPYLCQSLCHEAGRYFILTGRETEACRILTIGSRLTTKPTKELYLIYYLLGSTQKKRSNPEESLRFFQYVITNGKKYLHASQYASALYHIGDLFANYFQDSMQAHHFFEQALCINPQHNAAYEALHN